MKQLESLGSFTSLDGYTLVAVSDQFLDFGLVIFYGDEEIYFNPSCLSGDVYGYDYFSDSEECVPWSPDRWDLVLEEDHIPLLKKLIFSSEDQNC